MNDIESMQLALLQERGMSLANAQAVVQELSFSAVERAHRPRAVGLRAIQNREGIADKVCPSSG